MSPSERGHAGHYRNLAIMAVLSFLAMYVLMYAMVDRFANVHGNLNQAYMAALMTVPMIPFELLLMRSMYGSRSGRYGGERRPVKRARFPLHPYRGPGAMLFVPI